jgi:hypothetical protein
VEAVGFPENAQGHNISIDRTVFLRLRSFDSESHVPGDAFSAVVVANEAG